MLLINREWAPMDAKHVSRIYKAVQVTQPGKLEVAAEKSSWGQTLPKHYTWLK